MTCPYSGVYIKHNSKGHPETGDPFLGTQSFAGNDPETEIRPGGLIRFPLTDSSFHSIGVCGRIYKGIL